MRRLVLLLVVVISITACLPKRLDKWVAKQYGSVPQPSKKKSELITITSPLVILNDKNFNKRW